MQLLYLLLVCSGKTCFPAGIDRCADAFGRKSACLYAKDFFPPQAQIHRRWQQKWASTHRIVVCHSCRQTAVCASEPLRCPAYAPVAKTFMWNRSCREKDMWTKERTFMSWERVFSKHLSVKWKWVLMQVYAPCAKELKSQKILWSWKVTAMWLPGGRACPAVSIEASQLRREVPWSFASVPYCMASCQSCAYYISNVSAVSICDLSGKMSPLEHFGKSTAMIASHVSLYFFEDSESTVFHANEHGHIYSLLSTRT